MVVRGVEPWRANHSVWSSSDSMARAMRISKARSPKQNECAVGLRPVLGDGGARRGAVAREPFGLEFVRFHGARHEDFEGALTQVDGRDLVDGEREGFFEKAVEVVDMPVEFFLEGYHADAEGFGAVASVGDRGAGGNFARDQGSGQDRGPLVGVGLNGACDRLRTTSWQWQFEKLCEGKIKTKLPGFGRDSAANAVTTFRKADLSQPKTCNRAI